MDIESNPFNVLIEECGNNAAELEQRYALHREQRNSQQKAKLLAADFPGMGLDTILQRLEDPTIESGFTDPRFCFVFWARPPQRIKELIARVQEMLREAAPNLWIMPQDNLHMTVLEVTHSLTEPEILNIVKKMEPEIPSIVDLTFSRRTSLYKPMLSIDSQGIALTFLPKADKSQDMQGQYTYHHLRGDVWQKCFVAGAPINCRYISPSSHLTVGRFIDARDFAKDSSNGEVDPVKIAKWVAKVEEINSFLSSAEIIGDDDQAGLGEWTVGEGKGLDCRHGALWYGGGETTAVGKGF